MEAGAAKPFLPIAPTPWRFFGDFLAVQKVTRRRLRPQGALSAEMAAKLPCDKRRNAFIAPSSGPFRATYPLCRCATSSLDKGSRPPGGKAKKAGGKNST